MLRSIKVILGLILTIILVTTTCILASEIQEPSQPDPDLLSEHVCVLASDGMEGRLAGTSGCEAAADYIAEYFASLGLVPSDETDGDYFQEFEITTSVSLGSENQMQINNQANSEFFSLTVGEDFVPLFFSASGTVEGEVVFAGYGITAAEFEWDDYAEVDVEGKVVFCLRGEPGKDDPASIFNGDLPTVYSGLRWKAYNAQNHGACALILVTGPANLDEDETDELPQIGKSISFGEAGIPVIQVSQETANKIWGPMGAPLAMFQSEMDRHMMPFGSEIEGVDIGISVDLERERKTTWNVAGILPGTDPTSDEWVIIGAHYDHIGYGLDQGYGEVRDGEIHNGADDNSSGTSAVLELARMFSESPPRRNILFICFSAEEMGTLGSQAYVENPLVPLEQTSAMINLDMIGRVRPDESGTNLCTIQGIGSAEEWEEIVPDLTPDGEVALIGQPNPLGGSDYLPFYLAEVPAISFFSGIHDEFNTPADDPETLNYEGMASVTGAIFEIVTKIGNREELLTFKEWGIGAGEVSSDVDSGPTYSVYLGTIPDFVNTEGGLFIQGVTPGSPAEEAGLQAGDQIIRLGDYEVSDIYNYTYALGEYEPGDVVDIVIIRDGVEVVLTATLGARSED